MEYIKVKDKDHLVRDSYSNGIVNTDIDSYNAYINNYKKTYAESQKIKNLENDMKKQNEMQPYQRNMVTKIRYGVGLTTNVQSKKNKKWVYYCRE